MRVYHSEKNGVPAVTRKSAIILYDYGIYMTAELVLICNVRLQYKDTVRKTVDDVVLTFIPI